MTPFLDVAGTSHDAECVACDVQSGKIVLPVMRIAETKSFVVEQDSECAIEGFLVIVSKRHVFSIDEFNDEETIELARLVAATRRAMRAVFGNIGVTMVQEERTRTSHFHLWLFPWHGWMLERWSGKTNEMEEIMAYSRNNLSSPAVLEQVRETAARLKESLSNG